MNHAGFVGRFQSLRNLPGDRQGFVERNGTLGDATRQRRPLDQFEN